MLESTPECNLHCLHSVDSTRNAERKQRWLHWLRSRILSKMAEDGNSGRIIVESIMILLFI